ncbi:MAG TPA: hypothetical protein VF580_01650, partial [Thermoanaerobaculia bacterium]
MIPIRDTIPCRTVPMVNKVPAGLYLLGWFLLQFWMGSASIVTGANAAAQGGVAWWAHIGG